MKKLICLLGALAIPLPWVSGAEITFAWDANTDTATTNYILYAIQPGVSTNQIRVAHPTNIATATNITPGITYTYYVVAENADGMQSDPSDAITYSFPIGSPTLVTLSTKQVNYSPISKKFDVKLGWAAVDKTKYSFTNYFVEIVNTDSSVTNLAAVSTNSYYTNLPLANYQISVYWTNYLGTSPYASFNIDGRKPGLVKGFRLQPK